MTPIAPTIQAYFTDRLLRQQQLSPNTIASYRDTFRLLLTFAQQQTGTHPARLELDRLDAPLIGAFLEHLETERGNSARTRNVRLAAIHSFFNYCALRHPDHAELIARVLAIPPKRSQKRIVTFLQPDEVAGQMLEVVSLDRLGAVGRAVAALVRRDHPDARFAQRLDLITPGEGEFRPAMAQHQRRLVRLRTRIVVAHANPVRLRELKRRHFNHYGIPYSAAPLMSEAGGA